MVGPQEGAIDAGEAHRLQPHEGDMGDAPHSSGVATGSIGRRGRLEKESGWGAYRSP